MFTPAVEDDGNAAAMSVPDRVSALLEARGG
jgi:hypothetical protein